jgi:hypothetical protein
MHKAISSNRFAEAFDAPVHPTAVDPTNARNSCKPIEPRGLIAVLKVV